MVNTNHTYVGLATGREMRAAPWNAFHNNSSNFFAPGMLPIGVVLQDPSHISNGDLTEFFNHVIAMENPTDPNILPRRFRIHQIPTGSRTNPTWIPAVYNGVVERLEVKRGKKKLPVPTWDVSPSPLDDTPSVGSRDSDSPQPAGPVLSPIPVALEAQFEKVRINTPPGDTTAYVEDGDEGVAGTPSGAPLQAGTSLHVPPIATRRERRPAAAKPPSPPVPWIDGEIDAAGRIESSDDDSEIGNYLPMEDDDDEVEASDEEVEEFLKEDLELIARGVPEAEASGARIESSADTPPAGTYLSAIRSESVNMISWLTYSISLEQRAVISTMPIADVALLAPHDVGMEPAARLQFLQDLTADPDYVALLRRVSEKVCHINATIGDTMPDSHTARQEICVPWPRSRLLGDVGPYISPRPRGCNHGRAEGSRPHEMDCERSTRYRTTV